MQEEYTVICNECKIYYKESDRDNHKAYHDAIEQNKPALERMGAKIRKIINPYY